MRKGLYYNNFYQEGYVVFEHSNHLWWLCFLKPGFRHCYILLQTAQNPDSWLEINPMSNQICVFEHQSRIGIDYISYLQNIEKVTVVSVNFFAAPLKCAPFGVFTCVEFVKRMLGIHKFWLFTPYQLYNKIKNISKL